MIAPRRRPGLEKADVEAVVLTLALAVERRDSLTAGHCARLSLMSAEIGKRLGLSSQEICALERGGFLHDVGKVAVPDAILFKQGPLTQEEWAIMRHHTIAGEEICRPIRALEPVLPIIRHHHERWDGSGYPDGLAGDRIPLLARVIQVADIYDALTAVRPYKDAFSHREALSILAEEADRGWRDPELIRFFCQMQTPVSEPHALSLPACASL